MSEFDSKMLNFNKGSPFIYYSGISYYNEVNFVFLFL
jgi:hypothetical protein